MEKYNKYKDSSIEWVGVIPKHWEVKRIKDVFNKLGSGTTPKSSNKSYYEEGDVNWLNTMDLKNNVIYDTKLKITQKALNEVGLKVYPINSLAIAMYGQGKTRGSVGLLKVPTTTNQAACIMSKPIGVDTKFMLYWFVSKYTDIRSINVGATQPNMNQDFVKFLIIQKPPLKEQTQIANYLDAKTTAIDKKVTLLQQKIKHYKAYRKTLINETVTKGLDKTVKLKDSDISWIGLIPEHWEVNRMKKYFSIEKTKVGEFSSNFLLLSLTKKGVIPRDLEKNAGKFPAEFNTYQIVEPNDLIFCLFDLDVTPRTIGYSYHNGMITGAYTIIKSKKNIVNKYYYYMYLSIDDSKNLSLFYTGLRNTIKKDTFISLPIPIPSKQEQTEIANYLDAKTATIDKILKNIETQITTLKELRKTLINEVVTGKVKVTA